MTRKKHDRDPLDTDDPGHPDFPVAEGADVDLGMGLHAKAAAEPPVASTHHTVNQLMYEWWKLVKQTSPDEASIGDHFAAFAAAEGYQLVEVDQPPPLEEPAPE